MHRPGAGTVLKTEWSEHWAWRPVCSSYSGRWIWLQRYYRCSEHIRTPVVDMPYKLVRNYTELEGVMFMLRNKV